MSILKSAGRFFPVIIGTCLFVFFEAMPIAGPFFLGVMGSAATMVGLAHFGVGQEFGPTGLLLLGYGWKIYLGTAIFVMLAMTTRAYRNCCVDSNMFMAHLRHAGEDNFESFLVALFWPVSLIEVNRNLRSLHSSWTIIALNALEYWCVIVWRGAKVFTKGPASELTRVVETYIKPKK